MDGPWNDDSRKLAGSLFNACTESTFIISLVVANYYLHLLWSLTSKLQERELDIMAAYGEVDFVLTGLRKARESTALYENHKKLYARAITLANYVNVKPSKPRTCARMMHRDNHAVSEPFHYYRVTITTPFVDHLILEIEERFGEAPTTVVKGFSLIPAHVIRNQTWKNDFMKFYDTYQNDFPSRNTIAPELHLWETFWQIYTGSLPTSISDTLKITHEMQPTFPNIYTAL